MTKVVGVQVPPPAPRRARSTASLAASGLRNDAPTDNETICHAGYRNTVRRPQARIRVVVPAAELDTKVNARLDELKGRVRINGFRPGKVPVAHLKRLYGRSAMAEVIEAAVREANAKIVTDDGFKLAMRAAGHAADRGGRGRERDRGQGRSRLHGRDGDRAQDRARRLQGHQARAAGRRGDRQPRSTRRSSRIAEQNRPFAAKGEGAEGSERRQRHDLVHRHHRRRAVRGRHRRGRRGA